jgi:hypothetical protein
MRPVMMNIGLSLDPMAVILTVGITGGSFAAAAASARHCAVRGQGAGQVKREH